jgi:hypothetical protein
VRAVLLKELPALTRFYGLRPWEVEALSLEELIEYRSQMHTFIDEITRQGGG